MTNKHLGSTSDDFLREEGIFEEAQAVAVQEVVGWRLAEAMKEQKTPIAGCSEQERIKCYRR